MLRVDVRAVSPAELQQQLAAERDEEPFLIYRDGAGGQRIMRLGDLDRVTIGRLASNDLAVSWDPQVSRLHAELERAGEQWTLIDDGLSRNGSFVNGVRVLGRRRLRNGDRLRVGDTMICYRAPVQPTDPTMVPIAAGSPPELTEVQRRVLVALCRPCRDQGMPRAPATNREMAGELSYSLDAVKSHLRVLFAKFGVDHLPQNQKRLALVAEAFRTGAVSSRELEPGARRNG